MPAPKYSAEKQQELIFNAAVDCIRESSITDFTMASIAKKARLSMGSVYKFVQSKEDIVIALASEAFDYKSRVYERALKLPLSAPEKILSISLIAPAKLEYFGFDYDLENYATNEAVVRRASELWTNKMMASCFECEELFKRIIADDIANGALQTDDNMDGMIEQIIFSGWSITVGCEQVRRIKQTKEVIDGTSSLMEPLAIDDITITTVTRLMNSYPWRAPINETSLPRICNALKEIGLR